MPAPQPVHVATAWPPQAPAAQPDGPWSGSGHSLDPRSGPAFDPFAPQLAPGAATAAYPAIETHEGRSRGLLIALALAAVVALCSAIGVGIHYVTRKPPTPPRIVSVPLQAQVRVDGIAVPGLTPLVLPAALDATVPHQIDVSRQGFANFSITIPIGPAPPSYVAILTPQ